MNLYCSRENLKKAVGLNGTDQHAVIDGHLDAASREIEGQLHRKFYTATATRYFDGNGCRTLLLPVGDDLLTVTTLKVDSDRNDTWDMTLVVDTDYWLWPDNSSPKTRIDLNPNGTQISAWPKSRKSVQVVGAFGHSADTIAAGTITSGLASDAAATTFICSDGALIDVGNTLLIATEQMFVSERIANDVGKNTAGVLAASVTDVTLAVEASHGINAGEMIQVDSEKFYVSSVTGNNLAVIRGYDGSVIASHASGADVYAFRNLTVTRGVNGTTAAVHADALDISKYAYLADIVALCRAEAMFNYMQDKSGQSGQFGTDVAQRVDPATRNSLWRNARSAYGIGVLA